MDLWDNALVRPAFRENPPIKANISARTYGIVIMIIAALGTLFTLLLLPAIFSLNDLCNLVGGCRGQAIPILGVIIGAAALIITFVGGLYMYQGKPNGRALVVYGLLLSVIGELLYAITWGSFGSFIFDLIIAAIAYYFAVIARDPGEAPLALSGPPAMSGPPPSAPPPPPR